MIAKRGGLTLLLLLVCLPAAAHELRMAYVSVVEEPAGELRITTKTDRSTGLLPPPVTLDFEGRCRRTGPASMETTPETVIREWRVACEESLAGTRLTLGGLNVAQPHAIVRVALAGGEQTYFRADRHRPMVELAADGTSDPAPRLNAYFGLGIEHILGGLDHLLFVLGLVLVIWRSTHGAGALLAAVTAFTAAHSLTLALAVLGGVALPATAVEACIALSILLLAVELAGHNRRLAAGYRPSLTFRRPWLVAFAFGLLHGFGFAGALTAIGLPEAARGWALLLFNLGVEAGQLLFIAGLLLAYRAARSILPAPTVPAWTTTGIGAFAAYWFIDRLSLLIGA